jgi:hypothetical protein
VGGAKKELDLGSSYNDTLAVWLLCAAVWVLLWLLWLLETAEECDSVIPSDFSDASSPLSQTSTSRSKLCKNF